VEVEVSRYVFAPAEVVWAVLTDWEAQADWMVDAKAVEVLTRQRTGEGVRILVPTNVLGVTVEDEMEVTAWEEQRRLVVRHLGRVITGTGEFVLEPGRVGTRVTWRESIDPPLGPVGEIGSRVLVKPWVTRLFRRSLDQLKEACEREARRRRLGPRGLRGGAGRDADRDGSPVDET
jgi:carbon monoxide dehydrogenase subunit G